MLFNFQTLPFRQNSFTIVLVLYKHLLHFIDCHRSIIRSWFITKYNQNDQENINKMTFTNLQ